VCQSQMKFKVVVVCCLVRFTAHFKDSGISGRMRKIRALGEKLSQWHYLHYSFHNKYLGITYGPQQCVMSASNCLR